MIAAGQLATQLRASEQRFRAVVEAAPSAILLVDDKGTIALANAQAERVFGYPRAELVAKPVELLIPERFRVPHVRLRDAYSRDPQTRTMGTGRELFACRKDGSEVPVEAALSPMPTEEGMFVLASVVDISERRDLQRATARQRDELAHLSRVAMLGELSGSLAHELNQPLTAILSNAQAAQRFLAQSPPRLDKLTEILSDIVKSDHRAGAVIQRIRSLLRKESAQRNSLDMNDVVEETLSLIRSDLLYRQVLVRADLGEGLPAVSGDRNQLQQVLLNFMMNGCDAMDGREVNGRLRVGTRETANGNVEVSVADRGTGIPVGGPRADIRAVRDYQVARHGTGTDHLPIDRRGSWRPALGDQQSGRRRNAALRVACAADLTSMEDQAPTVYLVDDDPDVLKAIDRLLQSVGLRVITFLSPQQFLEDYDRNSPACLVLDLALPGLSGLELQQALEREASDLPIIFLTGRGSIASSVQAMKHGAADFLTKPVDDTRSDCRDSSGAGT